METGVWECDLLLLIVKHSWKIDVMPGFPFIVIKRWQWFLRRWISVAEPLVNLGSQLLLHDQEPENAILRAGKCQLEILQTRINARNLQCPQGFDSLIPCWVKPGKRCKFNVFRASSIYWKSSVTVGVTKLLKIWRKGKCIVSIQSTEENETIRAFSCFSKKITSIEDNLHRSSDNRNDKASCRKTVKFTNRFLFGRNLTQKKDLGFW